MISLLWDRDLGTAELGFLLHGLLQASMKVLVGQDHMKVQLGKGKLSSSCASWQNSLPLRLLDGGPQFFAGCWPETSLTTFPQELLQ